MTDNYEDSGFKPFFNPPKKRFGQHFLTDGNMIRKIASVARIIPDDHVLEIGPGRGALTEALLETGAHVLAIEVDKDLAAALKKNFSAYGNLEVITVDALKISFAELAAERKCKFKVVSNLPYYISGPVLAKFIRERGAFVSMALMFQREVAERIIARPDTKEYGVLSVLTQVWADVKIEFGVPRSLFKPKPKVDSSVVSFSILPEPRVNVGDEELFRKVVRGAFSTRRKMLPNALKSLGLEKDVVLQALGSANIDPQRRGETLSLAEFAALTDAFLTIIK